MSDEGVITLPPFRRAVYYGLRVDVFSESCRDPWLSPSFSAGLYMWRPETEDSYVSDFLAFYWILQQNSHLAAVHGRYSFPCKSCCLLWPKRLQTPSTPLFWPIFVIVIGTYSSFFGLIKNTAFDLSYSHYPKMDSTDKPSRCMMIWILRWKASFIKFSLISVIRFHAPMKLNFISQ